MAKGSTIKKKAAAAFLKFDLELLKLADLNPEELIICSESTPLSDALKGFLAIHCLDCKLKKKSSTTLGDHMSKEHCNKHRKTCQCCYQAVDHIAYHEFTIPKQFHSLFRKD